MSANALTFKQHAISRQSFKSFFNLNEYNINKFTVCTVRCIIIYAIFKYF